MAIVSKVTKNKIKFDVYDKKIIFYLSQNSRMPKEDLSKLIGISPQRAQYKINRLKREIIEPAAFINYPLLDINSYIIFVDRLNKEDTNKLIINDSIYFLMQCIGKHEWVLNVISQDIIKFCEEYLSNYHIDVYPVIHTFADDYNPFNLDIKSIPLKEDKKKELDFRDYKILKYISEKPLDSILEISKITGIDRQTIKQRILNLEDTNVIQKFRFNINVFKLGFITYILKIDVVPKNKTEILKHIRKNIYSGFVFETYFGFVMHYLPPNHNEVFKFTNNLKEIDPTIDIDIIQNTDYFKVDLVPPIVSHIFDKRIKKD